MRRSLFIAGRKHRTALTSESGLTRTDAGRLDQRHRAGMPMNERIETFELETERRGRVLVITPLANEITFKNTNLFLQSVKNLIGVEQKYIVLNMKRIEIIDSVSLGTLVAILKYVKSVGGDMAITNVAPPIDDLFNLLNFQTVFRTFETVEEAVEKF
jgi:anti-sigma B factor antagonist